MYKMLGIIFLLLVSGISYAQAYGFDPTQPSPPGDYAYTSATSSHGLRLDGIFSEPKKSTIIINGKILHIGESIEGYKITQISKNSVTLTSNTNESFTLKFTDFNFKQAHQ